MKIQTNKHGEGAIHVAAGLGQLDILKMLAAKGKHFHTSMDFDKNFSGWSQYLEKNKNGIGEMFGQFWPKICDWKITI